MAMEASYKWGNSTKQGPWGGEGGSQWDYKPNGAITEIIIGHGWFIDSISFKSVDNKGTVESSSKFGGGGGAISEILLKWPEEYLTSISGIYSRHQTSYAIQSLGFQTNKTTYGPFGRTEEGTTFNFSLKDGIIVGFYGCRSTLVDAIGIYVKPYADLFCPPSRFQLLQKERDVQPFHFIIRMETYSLVDGAGKKYESDNFEVGGYKWKMILFPKGDDTCNGKDHISLYLGIDESVFAKGSVVVDVKFFVLNQNTNKYLTIRDADGELLYFDKMRKEQGVSELLSLEVFKNPSNGYLVNDCCSFGVDILVQPASKTFTLVKDPVGRIYTWKLPKFSSLAETRYPRSLGTFSTGAGRNWHLFIFYPKGPRNDKFLAFHLKRVAPFTSRAYARAKLRVINHPGDKKIEKPVAGWFDEPKPQMGFPQFMPLSVLFDRNNEYLKDDVCILEVEFDVVSV